MKIKFKSLLAIFAFSQVSLPVNAQVNNEYEINYVCVVTGFKNVDGTEEWMKMDRNGAYWVDPTYKNYFRTNITIFNGMYKIIGPIPTYINNSDSTVKMPIIGSVNLGDLKSDGDEKIYDMTFGDLQGEWSSYGNFSVSLGSETIARLSCNEPSD